MSLQINPTTGTPIPPVIPSGDELYAQIMGDIEPDLLAENISIVQRKFADASEDEQQEMRERYTKAFERYNVELEQYQQKQSETIQSFGKAYITHIENIDRATELDALTALESTIQNS